MKSLSLLVFALLSLNLSARTLTEAQKLQDFHYLTSVIQAGYGPLNYKTDKKIVDVAALDAEYETAVKATTTNRDFYYLMARYIAAYKDGHFSIRNPSTQVAKLPVVTDLIDGKVLITGIDRTKLSEAQFPFAIGDEIIAVNGRPVADELNEISQYIGSGNPNSVRRLAAWSLFSRRAARLPLSGAKTVSIQIRRGTSGIVETTEQTWIYEGRALDQSATFNPADIGKFGVAPETPPQAPKANFDLLLNNSFQDFVSPYADNGYACSGDTRITIPTDATVIMKKPFVAYYHLTAKGNVGYLRIPHYYPQEPGKPELEVFWTWINQYQYAIRELEKNTVGLIIDQDHNCGGSVEIVNRTIAMFMDKPFQPSQFEFLASKESYLEFEGWRNATPQFTADRENIDKVLELVKTTWLTGTNRLTTKTTFDADSLYLPNPVHYTKPVVILIDEIAGSGGDMFPSMMQGLGRAKLFGQTTSGLGGHITMYPSPLPNSQLTFSLTRSLFYRPDAVAIENNGAVPDQLHTIVRDDVLYGFREYQKAYLEYLARFL